jgi:hypothetical protein
MENFNFCNLDYGWHPGINVCWDITRGLPFPNHYVGGVFTEHCLEHFSLDTALAILGEITSTPGVAVPLRSGHERRAETHV